MAVSKAQQQATNKWIAKAYDRINLTVPKGKRDEIREYAEANGESVNGFINRAIGAAMGETPAQKPAGAPESAENVLTSSALKTAQEAAQSAGETVPVFVERAVNAQSQRDKLTQKLKPKQEERENA